MKLLTFLRRRRCIGLLVISWAVTHLSVLQAQPTLVSTVPIDGATGISPSAAVVFTFSEPMDTSATEATFLDLSNPFTPLPTLATWSSGDMVLTCTPSPAFPANKMIFWGLEGQNPGGDPLEGENLAGFFTTGTGSVGGGGSGTNAITTFSVGKIHAYEQMSTGLPTLNEMASYFFSANTTLSSNRTATNIVLTLPTSSVSNLMQNLLRPESYALSAFSTNLPTFDVAFPAGNYTFDVKAVSSNQQVVVNLPTTNLMAQPGAPHVTNFDAAQTVDPALPFVLGWEPFPNGTSTDYVAVGIGNVYSSPVPGVAGALTGTATSFTIPAGTLQPNSSYDSEITFYRFVGVTNGTSHATLAYRATITRFFLYTTDGTAAGPLVLTNANWTPAAFSFDVLCTNGQMFTVEYTDNLSAVNWTTLLTTNCPGTPVHVVSPQSTTNKFLFYRARTGP